MSDNQNLKGQRFPKPKGPASLIVQPMRDVIMATINCFWNPKILVKYLASDGVSTMTKDADIIMSPLGWTATVDLTALSISGGGGGGTVQQFKIQSDGGDYWICKTWDGTTLGSTAINVAKPFKLRSGTGGISVEVIRGVTYSYTYSAVTVGGVTGYYTRLASGSDGTNETGYTIPDPIANDIIYGIAFSTTTPATLSAVTWLDINADGRVWCA